MIPGSGPGSSNDVMFDIDKYACEINLSVHVGSLHLVKTDCTPKVKEAIKVPLKTMKTDELREKATETKETTETFETAVIPETAEITKTAEIKETAEITKQFKITKTTGITEIAERTGSERIPEVSVLLPVRNGERYVLQSLLSVLSQAQDCFFEVGGTNRL